MAKKEIKYRFASNGKLWNHYAVRGDSVSSEVTEKTAEEARFNANLVFDRITRQGNHSVLAWFKIVAAPIDNGALGHEIHVFLSDLADMIPKMKNGRIAGNFIPTKRGTDQAWKLEK